MSKAKAPEKKGDGFTFVQKVIAGDTYLVMADSAVQMEDEFSGLYFTTESSSNIVLQPPFEPKVLARLPNLNNILSQCIEAMEVNVDGTGHEFVPAEEGGKIDEAEEKALHDFFNEPYPGRSFIQLRRRLRRDLESQGMAYLEVLRTLDGTVAMMRNIESTMMRLVKLDEAVMVKRTIMRGGQELEVSMMDRERRYCQKVGQNMIYYREFGSTRQLNKNTGEWVKEGEKPDPADLATEVLCFGVNPDIGTSYSVPRWQNQLPSVLGSRKAEEANLEFFDAGGMPPAIIFVQGGTMAASATDQLRGYLSGKSKNRQRAVVVEAQSTSGDLDKAGNVQIRVERFGSERANDAMYQSYDKAAEEHVRTAFRLPPLFLGRAADYNYATAVVAYMVAEEQVFRPERMEFDDTINKTIVKALGVKTVKFKSLPITLKNVENQLKALDMVKDKVKGEDYVAEVAQIGGVSVTYDKATDDATRQAAADALRARQQPEGQAKQPEQDDQGDGTEDPQEAKNPITKAETLVTLAKRYAQSRGILAVKSEFSPEDLADIDNSVAALTKDDLVTFNGLMATWAFQDDSAVFQHAAGCCN